MVECRLVSILCQGVFRSRQKRLAVRCDGQAFKRQIVADAACLAFVGNVGFRQSKFANETAIGLCFADKRPAVLIAFA